MLEECFFTVTLLFNFVLTQAREPREWPWNSSYPALFHKNSCDVWVGQPELCWALLLPWAQPSVLSTEQWSTTFTQIIFSFERTSNLNTSCLITVLRALASDFLFQLLRSTVATNNPNRDFGCFALGSLFSQLGDSKYTRTIFAITSRWTLKRYFAIQCDFLNRVRSLGQFFVHCFFLSSLPVALMVALPLRSPYFYELEQFTIFFFEHVSKCEGKFVGKSSAKGNLEIRIVNSDASRKVLVSGEKLLKVCSHPPPPPFPHTVIAHLRRKWAHIVLKLCFITGRCCRIMGEGDRTIDYRCEDKNLLGELWGDIGAII